MSVKMRVPDRDGEGGSLGDGVRNEPEEEPGDWLVQKLNASREARVASRRPRSDEFCR